MNVIWMRSISKKYTLGKGRFLYMITNRPWKEQSAKELLACEEWQEVRASLSLAIVVCVLSKQR